MKKLTIILAVLFATMSYGQMVNNKKIENIPSKYITVMGINKSPNPSVYVDYGQPRDGMRARTLKIEHYNGKEMKFNSVLEAVLYLCDFGYEIHTLSTSSSGVAVISFTYILEKK